MQLSSSNINIFMLHFIVLNVVQKELNKFEFEFHWLPKGFSCIIFFFFAEALLLGRHDVGGNRGMIKLCTSKILNVQESQRNCCLNTVMN